MWNVQLPILSFVHNSDLTGRHRVPHPPTKVGILWPLVNVLDGVWQVCLERLWEEAGGHSAKQAHQSEDAVHKSEIVFTLEV